MKDVIAIFDIGKTNKKFLLFDLNLALVYEIQTQFTEITDDDGDPCDDIESILKWMNSQIEKIQKGRQFQILAINFSTHGAGLIYIDEHGQRVSPLYNYLKKIKGVDFEAFYEKQNGKDEFSRKTASPAYGMLNSGLQILWFKNRKPKMWKQVKNILHYPQYLSYTFTEKITSDFTSIGAHTAMWDFDKMNYHRWLNEENISVLHPDSVKQNQLIDLNGNSVIVGSGMHDSSASLIPFIKKYQKQEFVLVSSGTWILCMNPFSKEPLTINQLTNNCLCFMTPEKKQVKSNMQMLGWVHNLNVKEISSFFNVAEDTFKNVEVNQNICKKIFDENKFEFFQKGIPENYLGNLKNLNRFKNFNLAYHQFMFELTSFVAKAINMILDCDSDLKDIFVTGGFNKNQLFTAYLSLFFPNQKIIKSNIQNASALGAAMMMAEAIEKNNKINS
ncbi:MAG: hypothetical protein JEY97_11955 [Bacteroidales bacterium]|nr:hypothetical protein [Bacteroidales bacterium]